MTWLGLMDALGAQLSEQPPIPAVGGWRNEALCGFSGEDDHSRYPGHHQPGRGDLPDDICEQGRRTHGAFAVDYRHRLSDRGPTYLAV